MIHLLIFENIFFLLKNYFCNYFQTLFTNYSIYCILKSNLTIYIICYMYDIFLRMCDHISNLKLKFNRKKKHTFFVV